MNHVIGNQRKALSVSSAQMTGKSRRCIILGTGTAPVCVDVVLGAGSHAINGTVGDIITPYVIPISAGSAPYTFAIASGGLAPDLALNTSTGEISGSFSLAGSYLASVRVSNACPSEAFIDISSTVAATPPTPYRIRWGNVTFADGPFPLPTFNEAFFLSPTIYIPKGNTNPGVLNGSYIFDPGSGVHQVMFVADILLSGDPIFTVGGADWGLTPGANQAVQSLTVAGIAGKVFYTSFQNNGGYTVDALP